MSSSSSVKLHPGVDTWEARLNPFLDDEQKELIAALAAASYERPYPSFLKGQQDTTATTAAVASDEDRSPTIESLPKFESWFKTIEDSLLDEEEEQVCMQNTLRLQLLKMSTIGDDPIFALEELFVQKV